MTLNNQNGVAHASQRVESRFLRYLVDDVDFIPTTNTYVVRMPPTPIITRGLLSLLLADSFEMWYEMLNPLAFNMLKPAT